MDFSAGIVLILIGILSYVIPLLGVQFILVWLLNGPTFGLGGIVCIVAGIVLIILELRRKKELAP